MANYVSQYTGDEIDGAVTNSHEAEDWVVEVGDGVQYGGTDDYTLEAGRWHYRKWNSGIMECWTRAYYTGVVPSSEWGGGVYHKLLCPDDYPIAFHNSPAVTVSANVRGGWGLLILDTSATNQRASDAFIWCPSELPQSVESLNVQLNYYVIGRWKS